MKYFSNFNLYLRNFNIVFGVASILLERRFGDHVFLFAACLVGLGLIDAFLRFMYKTSVDSGNYKIFAGFNLNEPIEVQKMQIHNATTAHSFAISAVIAIKYVQLAFRLKMNYILIAIITYIVLFIGGYFWGKYIAKRKYEKLKSGDEL